MPLAPTAEVASNVTVFVGDNGAGKTVLLKSLAASLSWFVARLRSEKGSGSPIQEDEIFNKESSGAVDVEVSNGGLYRWTLAKTRSGKKGEFRSQLEEASALADSYRAAFTGNEGSSMPLVAFYTVERAVLDIPLKVRQKHGFAQLDGYDNSLSQGVDFRRFFEWFREREDAENESGISQEALLRLSESVDRSSDIWKELEKLHASSRDRQLTAVRNAIGVFMPGFSNLRVCRKPLRMSVDKEGEAFNVMQLSQGEKSLMALVGDIARRLAMMNPDLTNPLHGDGIVLIDEVDLHLHPTWQRGIAGRLTDTFPGCQFVLTTHSPLVISDFKDMLVYSLHRDGVTRIPSQYGNDVNSVLTDVMDTPVRDPRIEVRLNDLLDLIHDEKIPEAKTLIESLKKELPALNIDVVKSKMLLRKQELRNEIAAV